MTKIEKMINRVTTAVVIALAALMVTGSATRAANPAALNDVAGEIRNIYGLTDRQKTGLEAQFRQVFAAEFDNYTIGAKKTEAAKSLITNIIADALSGDTPIDRIIRAAHVSYKAFNLGANPEYLFELYPYALDMPEITAEQLAGASAYADRIFKRGLPVSESQELLYYALRAGLKREDILSVADGLEKASAEGVPIPQFALALIIRLQTKPTVSIDTLVREEIVHVKQLLSVAETTVPGVPEAIIQELHYNCFSANFNDAQVAQVDAAMKRAVDAGLPVEIMARAILIQLQSGFPGKTISQMLDDEFKRVYRLVNRDFDIEQAAARYKKGYEYYQQKKYYKAEQEYMTALEYHPEFEESLYWLAKTYFAQKRYKPAEEYLIRTLKLNPNHTDARRLLDRIKGIRLQEEDRPTGAIFAFDPDELEAVAQEYLGVPYVWGGESHRGTDCSGLVYIIYNRLSLGLERLSSRDYYKHRRLIPVRRDELQPGDLVFFDSGQKGYITHIAIYIGNGKIVNARKSSGCVVIDRLDMNYWSRHWVGARRYKG